MSAFPTLSVAPMYPIDPDGAIEDNVLRAPQEGGYEQTRPRFTRVRQSFGLRYRLPAADVDTLKTFERTTLRNGADSFTWTHPKTGTTYTVRLTAPITFAYANEGFWDAGLSLREV